jgi:hypothetical protein
MGEYYQTQAELAMYEVVRGEVSYFNGYHRSDNSFACYFCSPTGFPVLKTKGLLLKHINDGTETVWDFNKTTGISIWLPFTTCSQKLRPKFQ